MAYTAQVHSRRECTGMPGSLVPFFCKDPDLRRYRSVSADGDTARRTTLASNSTAAPDSHTEEPHPKRQYPSWAGPGLLAERKRQAESRFLGVDRQRASRQITSSPLAAHHWNLEAQVTHAARTSCSCTNRWVLGRGVGRVRFRARLGRWRACLLQSCHFPLGSLRHRPRRGRRRTHGARVAAAEMVANARLQLLVPTARRAAGVRARGRESSTRGVAASKS